MTWIELEGAANVRDVGGLPTVDGRETRPQVLVRSDNLQGLTEADVSRLRRDLQVRTVIDLRTTGEVELEGPGPLRQTEVVHHHLSLIPEEPAEPAEEEVDRAVQRGLATRERAPASPGGPVDMTGHYIGYVEQAPESIAEALRVLADPASGTAVVHCAAGKDRTGVVVALALSLAGVTREAVLEDYLRTAERVDAVLDRLKASRTYADDLRDATPDDVRPVAAALEGVLDHVDRTYGGPHGLAMSIGVDEETVTRLARRLVGPSPHAVPEERGE